MADISKIKLSDNSEYNLKDASVPSWARGASKPTYNNSELTTFFSAGASSLSLTAYSAVPVVARCYLVTTSTSGSTFGISGTMAEGQELHVLIKNSGSSAITVNIPSNSTWVNVIGDNLSIDAGKIGEINVIKIGSVHYVRAI